MMHCLGMQSEVHVQLLCLSHFRRTKNKKRQFPNRSTAHTLALLPNIPFIILTAVKTSCLPLSFQPCSVYFVCLHSFHLPNGSMKGEAGTKSTVPSRGRHSPERLSHLLMLPQLEYGAKIRATLVGPGFSPLFLLGGRPWEMASQAPTCFPHHMETHSKHGEIFSKFLERLTGQRGVWHKACGPWPPGTSLRH